MLHQPAPDRWSDPEQARHGNERQNDADGRPGPGASPEDQSGEQASEDRPEEDPPTRPERASRGADDPDDGPADGRQPGPKPTGATPRPPPGPSGGPEPPEAAPYGTTAHRRFSRTPSVAPSRMRSQSAGNDRPAQAAIRGRYERSVSPGSVFSSIRYGRVPSTRRSTRL